MKWLKNTLLIWLLLNSGILSAENHPCAAIHLDRMNVLYVGVSNSVSYSFPGYFIEEMGIRINNGASIISTGLGTCNIKIPGKAVYTIEIYHRNPENGVEQNIYSGTYRGKDIPSPDVYLSGIKAGDLEMAGSVIREAKSIEGKPSGFDFQVKFEIAEFDLVVINTAGKRTTIRNTGDQFNTASRALLATVTKGDVIMLLQTKGKYTTSDTKYTIAPVVWIAG